MGYPRFQRARAHKHVHVNGAGIAINSTTYVALFSGAADLMIEAQAGDVVEVSGAGVWNDETIEGHLNVATMNGGTVINYICVATKGIPNWWGRASVVFPIGVPYRYTLVAGDIVGGKATFRMMAKGSSAATKTFLGGDFGQSFAVKNLGPTDPN